MGVLTLVSADRLAAVYNPRDEKLMLSASGSAPNVTYGFYFKQLLLDEDGLTYELQAWNSPRGADSKPYTHSQVFTVPNMLKTNPSDTIDVITLNHPEGVGVRISWLSHDGGDDAGAGERSADMLQAALDKFEPIERPLPAQDHDKADAHNNNNKRHKDLFTKKFSSSFTPHSGLFGQQSAVGTRRKFTTRTQFTRLVVLYRAAFDIAGSAGYVSRDCDVQYDASMVHMEQAGTVRGELSWTFNSLQTGATQIVLTRVDNSERVIRVYDVRIILLGDVSAVLHDSTAGDAAAAASSFIGRIHVAQRITRRLAPEDSTVAALLLVRASVPEGSRCPASDPLCLTLLECVFRTTTTTSTTTGTDAGAGGGSASIVSTGWAEWAPPRFRERCVLGLRDLPRDLGKQLLDFEDAGAALRKHGIKGAYWRASLYWALQPPRPAAGAASDKQPGVGVESWSATAEGGGGNGSGGAGGEDAAAAGQAYYHFDMEDGSCVAVGATDGRVSEATHKYVIYSDLKQ